ELARLYRLVNQLSEYHESAESLPRLDERIAAQEARIASCEQDSPPEKAQQKRVKDLRDALAQLKAERAAALRKQDAVRADSQLQKLADAHPQIARGARDETARLHAGDP